MQTPGRGFAPGRLARQMDFCGEPIATATNLAGSDRAATVPGLYRSRRSMIIGSNVRSVCVMTS
jgi:hypothetical protein